MNVKIGDDDELGTFIFRTTVEQTPLDSILQSRHQADAIFRQQGITFTVYGDNAGTERLIPFDIIPRIIPAHEWQVMSKGCEQRVLALNAFLHDIYHDCASPPDKVVAA